MKHLSQDASEHFIRTRLLYALAAFQEIWASSLKLRVIATIAGGSIIGASVIGIVITNQLRSSVFHQTVQTNVDQFSANAKAAQNSFSSGALATAGQVQEIANSVVESMYDPNRGLMGAVLMRSSGQQAAAVQIIEPSTASSTVLRALVTDELREAVAGTGDIAWQSAALPSDTSDTDDTIPALVIGTDIQIPSAGNYELYAVYSLQDQQHMLDSIYKVLSFAIVALMLFLTMLVVVILRMVLGPVQEAAQGAQQLAEGDLKTRMDVVGSDEFARLAVSFNKMAGSIDEQFTRLERMSQVQTAFVSAVSHELRSPVTTIRMAGQLIYDRREELPSSLKRSAELQHRQLVKLDAMLSDLLEISRYDAGGMNLATRVADIAHIAQNVMEMVEPLARDNHVQIVFSQEGDTSAEVDPRRIERIIRNLLVNALEHAQENPVHVRVVANTTAVAVAVTDHGVGLTEEQARHVFDRFWRADPSRVRKTGGTGLGLTIAREDAQIHGGTLAATGKLGVGATFLLTVPKQPGHAYTAPIQMTSYLPDSPAAVEQTSAQDGERS